MINLSNSLHLNKFEKIAISVIFFIILATTTVNIIFVADLFGISITSDIVGRVWDYIEGGTGVATAISYVLGVTIPAWAAPVIAAVGVVSA